MDFFDNHSHYNDEKFDEDREEIIVKTKEDGITKFNCVGYDVPSSKFSLELANRYPFIYAILAYSLEKDNSHLAFFVDFGENERKSRKLQKEALL